MKREVPVFTLVWQKIVTTRAHVHFFPTERQAKEWGINAGSDG